MTKGARFKGKAHAFVPDRASAQAAPKSGQARASDLLRPEMNYEKYKKV
jgi:hypothetical protein